MANIFGYNYDSFMEANPELKYRTNGDWLKSTPGAKYTTGTKGIANAYIPDEGDLTPLIINEKNAMYALLFEASSRLFDIDHRYKGIRDFDRMLYALLPKDDEASQIKDPFYRRLFMRSGIKDDVRNAINSKAFKRLFTYEIKSRYSCCNETLGGQYTEDEIRVLAQELYEIEVEAETNTTGCVGLTNLSRCLVQERCANRLRQLYGWEFEYREFGEVEIYTELLDQVKLAYPHIKEIVDKVLECLNKDSERFASPGMMRVASPDLNPIANFFVYQRSFYNGLRIAEDLIGYTEEDYQVWKKRLSNDESNDQKLRDEYVLICVKDFVLKTNEKREVYPNTEKVMATVHQIAIYIRNYQIRLKEL